MSFDIVTDTSANLQNEQVRQYGITVIPLSYYIDGREHTCLDTDAFDQKGFYDAMRAKAEVTTSLVNVQQCMDCFASLLERGRDILFAGMSSGISGTFSAAAAAARQLRERFPARVIRLVDTLSASLGEGLLVLRAALCREKGMGLDETAEMLSSLRHRMCQLFTVDDLMFLRRGGRISSMKAVVGTLLHVKPLLKGDEAGRIVVFDKAWGRKSAIQMLAERYDNSVVHPEEQTVGIAHADCGEDAALLSRLLRAKRPPKEIMNVCYEPVTGSHVGPGALALFFFGGEGVRLS